MKNFLTIVSLLFTNTIFADTINGSGNIKNQSFNNLEVNGSLRFDNLKIANKFAINGSGNGKNLTAQNAEINGSLSVNGMTTNNITVEGSLNGENIEVKSNTVIFGGLFVKNSHFQNIEITSDNISFTDSTVNDIVIKDSISKYQTLTLKNTQVNGNINFESERGKIKMDDKSQVKGKITGLMN